MMQEPDFLELCNVARRLEPLQRDRLLDALFNDQLSELSRGLDKDLPGLLETLQ